MPGRRLALIVALLCWLLRVDWTLAAVPQFAPSARRVQQFVAGQRQNFLGVIGEVLRPGVYEFSTPFPRLVDLIEQAGGLTKHASGNIRIIRNCRAGQQTFYSPHLKLTLLAGDVIFVDGRESQGIGVGPRGGQQNRPTRNTSDSDSTSPLSVQVGLVNLIDRPVVLKIREEYASVAGIVRLLEQRPEIIGSVKVIGTSTPRFHAKRLLKPTSPLPSGTVLLFDPSVIQFNRIPPFPKPHLIGAKKTEPKAKPETNTVRLLKPPNDDRPKAPVAAPDKIRVSSADTGLKLPSQKSQQAEPTSETGKDAERPPAAKADADSADDPQIAESSSAALAASSVSSATDTSSIQSRSAAKEIRPQDSTAPNVADGTTSGNLTAIGIGIVVMLVVSIAFALLWSMARSAEAAIREPAEDQKTNLLDALIDNRLSTIEEPLRFPSTLEFYGQPTGVRKIRIDAGAGIGGPHFQPKAVPAAKIDVPPSPSAKTKSASSELSSQPKTKHSATDPARRPSSRPTAEKQAGLLDRVLSSVHGAAQT